jgi:hypothetical protein
MERIARFTRLESFTVAKSSITSSTTFCSISSIGLNLEHFCPAGIGTHALAALARLHAIRDLRLRLLMAENTEEGDSPDKV